MSKWVCVDYSETPLTGEYEERLQDSGMHYRIEKCSTKSCYALYVQQKDVQLYQLIKARILEEREELCMIGRQLGTLNADDIAFIMNVSNSSIAVNRRMATARNRVIDMEMNAGVKAAPVMRIKNETLPVLSIV